MHFHKKQLEVFKCFQRIFLQMRLLGFVKVSNSEQDDFYLRIYRQVGAILFVCMFSVFDLTAFLV